MVTLLTYYYECYIIHTQSIFQRRVLRWNYKAWQIQYSCYCTCREKNRQEDELLYCFGTLRFQAIHIDVEKEESSFNSFIFRITITVVSVSLQAELRSYSFAAVFLRRFSLETFPTFHSECVNRNLLLDGLDVHKILTREVKPSRVRIEFQSHVCKRIDPCSVLKVRKLRRTIEISATRIGGLFSCSVYWLLWKKYRKHSLKRSCRNVVDLKDLSILFQGGHFALDLIYGMTSCADEILA